MHPSDDALQALLDDELVGAEADTVRVHVASCGRCRSQSDTMRRAHDETTELLQALDDPLPDVSADDLIQRASRRDEPEPSIGLPWAAVVAGLIVAGGLVAAIVPGSPLREAVERFVGSESRSGEIDTPEEPWREEAGVALVPLQQLDIVFQAEQREGFVQLVETGENTARVEVRGDSVRFTVGDQSIRVENESARASYRITLPAELSTASIRVGERVVYEKRDGSVLEDAFEDPDRRLPFSAPTARE